MVLISTNEKHFPKTISQWECDYGLFTNLPRIIVPCDFSEFIQTQKRYPIAWQNMYPNLKTTSHIKLKFFLWTKLLENLLLAVTPLKTSKNEKPNIFQEIGIPEIHVQLFENFENLIALQVWCQVWCLVFTKNVEWLANETVLGQSSPNSSVGKICKNLQNTQHKSYLM